MRVGDLSLSERKVVKYKAACLPACYLARNTFFHTTARMLKVNFFALKKY